MTPTHAMAAIAPSTAEPRFSANIYLIIQNNKILFERWDFIIDVLISLILTCQLWNIRQNQQKLLQICIDP